MGRVAPASPPLRAGQRRSAPVPWHPVGSHTMSDLFRAAPLVEKYRPQSWADVAGQEKVVAKLRALLARGALAGRAYFLSGASGTGKTTIARLIAAEVASEW